MKCKVVLLGDQSVGKTSVINRFIFDNFTGNEQVLLFIIQPTVGVDFVSKTINVDNKTLRMQLWDTAGQERFHSLIPSYIKDCSAAIIVFDLTSNSTLIQTPILSTTSENGSTTYAKSADKKPSSWSSVLL